MSVVSITKQPLLPVITIEKNDASVYTFNHFTGTYGFRIRSCHVEPPKDNAKGTFTLKLTSNTATNADTNTLLDNIRRGNEISISVGKNNTDKTLVFLGTIETLEINEMNYGYMDVIISGPDWGSNLLKSRVIYSQWAQDKELDGITLDISDTKTTIQQIVLDMLTKTSSYPSQDITLEDQGLIVNTANIKTPAIQMASFLANFERADDKITELDSIGGTFHWVGPDKVFHMEVPEENTLSRPADILVTDDYSNATALAWDQDKVGLILQNSTYGITVENRKSRLYGIGGDFEQLDKQSTTNGGSTSCYNQYIAMKFQPTKRFLEGVDLYVSKTGDPPSSSLTLLVIEDNNGEPTGDIMSSQKLDKRYVASGGGWSTWKTQVELNTAKEYWLTLQINPGDDSSNHYNWFHDAGSSGTNATSSDGDAWTVNTSSLSYMFRTYVTTPLLSIKADNTSLATSKHYHEDVIVKQDITLATVLWKLLQGESITAFKEKETLKCRLYAPNTVLQAGARIKIIKTASGKNINTDTDGLGDFILSSVSYDFDSNNDKATGTFYYDVELVRFVDYT